MMDLLDLITRVHNVVWFLHKGALLSAAGGVTLNFGKKTFKGLPHELLFPFFFHELLFPVF